MNFFGGGGVGIGAVKSVGHIQDDRQGPGRLEGGSCGMGKAW